MAMGECSAYSSLQADSKVKFAAWPTSWRPPGADRLRSRETTVNSRIWLAPYGTDEPGPWRGGAAHGVLMTRRAVLLVLFSQHSG